MTLVASVALGLAMTFGPAGGDEFNVNTNPAPPGSSAAGRQGSCRTTRDAELSTIRRDAAAQQAAVRDAAEQQFAGCHGKYECKISIQKDVRDASAAINVAQAAAERKAYRDFYNCLAQAQAESAPGSTPPGSGPVAGSAAPAPSRPAPPPPPEVPVPNVPAPTTTSGASGSSPTTPAPSGGTSSTAPGGSGTTAGVPTPAQWESTLKGAITKKVREKQGDRTVGDGSPIRLRLTVTGDGGLNRYQPAGTNGELAGIIIEAIGELRDRKNPMAPVLWRPPDRRSHTIDLTVEATRPGFLPGDVTENAPPDAGSTTPPGGTQSPTSDAGWANPIRRQNGTITGWDGPVRKGRALTTVLSGRNGFTGVFNVPDSLIDAVKGQGQVPADVTQGSIRAQGKFYYGTDGNLHFSGQISENGQPVSNRDHAFFRGLGTYANGQVTLSYD